MFRKWIIPFILVSLLVPAMLTFAQEAPPEAPGALCSRDEVMAWRESVIGAFEAEVGPFTGLPEPGHLLEMNAFQIVEGHSRLLAFREIVQRTEFPECLALLRAIFLSVLDDFQGLLTMVGQANDRAQLIREGQFLQVMVVANRKLGRFEGYLLALGFENEGLENFWRVRDLPARE